MFGDSRSDLSPSIALALANSYMETARRNTGQPALVLEFCMDADRALSRIPRSAKRALLNSTSFADKATASLREGIAAAYYEHGQMFQRLGHPEEAQRSYRKAEKWGFNGSNKNVSSANVPARNIATIPADIFDKDMPPIVAKYSLPNADEPLNNVNQLVYCLSLLPNTPIQLSDLTEPEREWSLTRANDTDEKERLHNLAVDLLYMFINDGVKAEATVTEVVSLAPVLEQVHFRKLLMTLANGINQNIMLDTHLLEGLAQAMQHGHPKHLESDDLVTLLNILSSRLQDTHFQSSDHIYRLTVTVSHVLDTMVGNQVTGLKREQLHEPLSAYLSELKNSSDPYLVYYAAYAFQALQYIPDDEPTMQTFLRRTSAVLRGVFGVVSAVKGLDINTLINELEKVQTQLPSLVDIVNLSKLIYDGTTSLVGSGSTFMECMKEGLSFARKTAWYPALRMADAFLQTGELTKFKDFVCEVPCRLDPAFQWGLCQRLGQIAANLHWAMDTRQDAVSFLGEIYKNDSDWGSHAHIKQWILIILKKLSSHSTNNLQAAEEVLLELADDGDIRKQELYRVCMNEPPCQYPIIVTLPPPASPSLLDRVQKKPDVEKSLRQLKRQRITSQDDKGFYIPLFAKATLQARDDDVFLLMDKIKDFISSDREVFLVQGDSGAGKSTFNLTLERYLWEGYKNKTGWIPLYISLPAIANPERDLVAKQLRKADFTEPQIKELKVNRKFILICDGYDESKQANNLHTTNRLNQHEGWHAKMVISCRSEYLGKDYRGRFMPINRHRQAEVELFQEAVIAPFTETQIDDFIKRYVESKDPLWRVKDYQRALQQVPSLKELVKNPFLLSLSLDVLPRMVDPYDGLTGKEIRRVSLYDQFVELWLERGKNRVYESLGVEDRRTFQILSDEGFAQNGIQYLIDLAIAIYRYQSGNPVVNYSPFKHKGTWKEEFFSRENGKYLLREASPLKRTGNQHRFVHRSILEYSLARAIFEPQEGRATNINIAEASAEASQRRNSASSILSFENQDSMEDEEDADPAVPDATSPLFWRSFVDEPSILQFLVDRVQLEPMFKKQLLAYVECSKTDSQWRVAAANAITVLVRAGVSFTGASLQGIRIPGADLSNGIFDSCQLQGADLRKAKMHRSWLRKADMSNSRMIDIRLGEWPVIEESSWVRWGSYSPNGTTLAAITRDRTIVIYDSSSWEKLQTLPGLSVFSFKFAYSPNGQHIAFCNDKHMIQVYDVAAGDLVHSHQGHSDKVRCIVYSPNGHQIASGGEDCTLYIWDTQSGAVQHKWGDHTDTVVDVVYSPDGDRIASASNDMTVRVWDVMSGELKLVLNDPDDCLSGITYSPDGQWIASVNELGAVRLWDAQTGMLKWVVVKPFGYDPKVRFSPNGLHIVSMNDTATSVYEAKTGKLIHALETTDASRVQDLAFSPNGEQIATCNVDHTVRLWDARSGQLLNTAYGHKSQVFSVAFSPSGHQIASFSEDKTIRLWDSQLARSNNETRYGHTKQINCMAISPDGKQISSGSNDCTVRLWDVQTGDIIRTLRGHKGGIHSVKYSSIGQHLASRDHNQTLHIWDTRSGELIYALERQELQDIQCKGLDYSPSGYQLAFGNYDGTISIWDTQKQEIAFSLKQHEGAQTNENVYWLSFSPDGQQIAACVSGGIFKLWSAHSGKFVRALEGPLDIPHLTHSIAYSPDSRYIAANGSSKEMLVWDTTTGQLCRKIFFDSQQSSLAFPPSSSSWQREVLSGGFDGTVSVLDIESGQVLQKLEGHSSVVAVMEYSPPDDNDVGDTKPMYLATGSIDMTVRLWNPVSGQCLAVIPYFGVYTSTLTWRIFTEGSGGFFLMTGCNDGSIWTWHIFNDTIGKTEGTTETEKEGEDTREGHNQCQYRLRWTSKQMVLNAENASIQGVGGLSEVNKKLFEERGAVGIPAAAPSRIGLYEASRRLGIIRSVAFKLKTPSSSSSSSSPPSSLPLSDKNRGRLQKDPSEAEARTHLKESLLKELLTLMDEKEIIDSNGHRLTYSICDECDVGHICCKPTCK